MKVAVSVRMYTLERAYCQLGIVIGRKVLAQPIRDQSNFYKILLWGLLSCCGGCCLTKVFLEQAAPVKNRKAKKIAKDIHLP